MSARNVLADRHHAGLFRSLQLLADRLGWTLYTPQGRAWWDADYWAFGRRTYGDDRLARQFLGASGPDEEFPDAPVRYVSLEEARAMPWAFVIASLDDNQAGFARFAAETGARYLVQCGNTGQYIDWSLDPIVLNSSEMPLLGRGVTYHQELDPVFRWAEPWARRSVRSFVHLMNETHAFPIWNYLAESLPDFGFQRFGHAPPNPDPTYVENAKPIAKIAALMARSGWGFHDKPVGDGHGHVIHGWSAIGRPLIGHGSHYAGKMAGVFWQDLVTCIDLDLHPLPEAAALIREISADPDRHAAMCRAIRGVFDATVDYDAEAVAIRELLA